MDDEALLDWCDTGMGFDNRQLPVFCNFDITEIGENIANNNPIAVYPNPTDGVLFVQTLRATSLPDQTYRITNLMGQTLLTGQIMAETQQIDVAALPEGVYFITVGETTRKFVVR